MKAGILWFIGTSSSWPLGWRLALAGGLVALVTGGRLLLGAEFAHYLIFMSYMPAVAVAAMLTGVGGGLFATALALLATQIIFVPRIDAMDLAAVTMFLLASATMVGMAGLIQFGKSRLALAAQLERSESELRAFITQAPVAVAMFDTDMKYIAISERWRKDYALEGRQILGQSYYDVLPEISDAWKDVHRRALSGEEAKMEEDLFHRADGSAQWLRWEVKPWRLNGERVGGIIINTEDITARKEAQERLVESEASFRAMFENSTVGMAQVSRDGVFIRSNKRLCEILGFSSEQLARRRFQELTHEDDVAEDAALVTKLQAGTIDHFRRLKRYRRSDGNLIWAVISVGAVRALDGSFAYAVAVIEDITERRKAEEKSRKYSRVIEQAASSVIITDASGVIEYVNPHFSQITGFASEEVVGKRANIVKSDHTPEAEYRNLWHTIANGGVWRGEFRNRRKDGSLYWESAIVSPIRDTDGKISHFASIQEDISDRKEIEKEFAEIQRMEAVSRLAGSIAHDFNNLLAVIAGNLELIEQRTPDEAIKALAGSALAASYAGAGFNRRLLSLSGRHRTAPTALTVNDHVNDARVLYRHAAGHDIELQLDLADGLWPVTADAGEMDSALLNLLINSRDAMPRGGRIVIQTRNVGIDALTSNLSDNPGVRDYVRISVIDTGEGMIKEVLEQAFEPFFTTKKVGKGTGLGLSSVRNFVTQSGGFTTIESRPADGTTVNLFLPRASAQRQLSKPFLDQELPYGGGETVLVVEDDKSVREATLKRVEALGYAVEEAHCGTEAIRLLKARPDIKLMLSDIAMSGMNGLELARKVREEAPDVRIVLATGFNGGVSHGTELVADAPILQKPYSREQLANTLARALKSSTLSERV